MRVLSVDVGTVNYAMCACTLPDVQVLHMESWRLGDMKAAPASFLVDRMLERWDTWCLANSGWEPECVVIEQQMRGAHANLALAFSTYTYMRVRFPRSRIKFVGPAAKFKGYRKVLGSVAATFPDVPPAGYSARKRMAVAIADAILVSFNQPRLATFCRDTDKKQDDIGDAFLQSFCALVE
jgi:hypothetical protein